jgi:MFS family permease
MSIAQRVVAAGFSASVRRVLLHALFVGLALSVTDILLPFYLISLGYSTAEVGVFSTISRFAGMLTALPLGRLTDRMGPQNALRLGLIASAVSWLLMLLAPTLPLMMMAQFLIGSGLFLIFGSSTPLMSLLVEERQRSQVFAVNEFMYVFLGLIGSALGGALPGLVAAIGGLPVGSAAAYRLALMIGASLLLVATLPLIGKLQGNAHGGAGGAAALPEMAPVSGWRLVRLGLPSLFFGLTAGAVLPFQGLFLRETFALSDADVGLILAAASFAGGIGALSSPLVVRALGQRQGASLLRMLLGVGIALLLLPLLPGVVLGLMLRSFFFSASVPQGHALLLGLTPPQQRGRLSSVMSLQWATGWATASLLSGWINPQFGFLPGFAAAAVFAVCSALSMYTLRDAGRH